MSKRRIRVRFRGPGGADSRVARGSKTGLDRIIFAFFLSVLGLVTAAETAGAGEMAPRPRAAKPERGAGKTSRFKAPYRDSEIVYRNVVSARSFDRNADLTYNPYYAMELDLYPVFWLSKRVYSALDVVLIREFTNSDKTTKQGETVLEDIYLAFGANKILTIPVVEIHLSPSLRFYMPTSKVSKARTLILGIQPRLTLLRRFNVLRGLTLSYRIAFRGDLHESTTAESEAPLVSSAMGSTRSLESFSNLGVRNTKFGISNIFGIKLDIKKWIGLEVKAAVIHGFLYDLTIDDERVSYEPQASTDVRYLMKYEGEIYTRPLRCLTVALGFVTENYQLAPDSTYEAPFFNRYTAPYLDLRLDLAALSKQLKKKRVKKKRGRK